MERGGAKRTREDGSGVEGIEDNGVRRGGAALRSAGEHGASALHRESRGQQPGRMFAHPRSH